MGSACTSTKKVTEPIMLLRMNTDGTIQDYKSLLHNNSDQLLDKEDKQHYQIGIYFLYDRIRKSEKRNSKEE